MAHQALHCDTLVLGRIDTPFAGIRPGAATLAATLVVVDIPVRVYAVVQQWPDEHSPRGFSVYFSVPALRGPPQHLQVPTSCRGARSCAPPIIQTLVPDGVYAS